MSGDFDRGRKNAVINPQMLGLQRLALGFRFGVVFFRDGLFPNLWDIRFQKVSGLDVTVNTTSVEEGGENLYTRRFPQQIEYSNLVLERGMFVLSPLTIDFNAAMSAFDFATYNVLVTLLDDYGLPLGGAGWLVLNAYPVKWSVSDLDAGNNEVVIERMELAYDNILILRI